MRLGEDYDIELWFQCVQVLNDFVYIAASCGAGLPRIDYNPLLHSHSIPHARFCSFELHHVIIEGNMQRIIERYRYPLVLLKQLVKTDFTLRYQGSALGYVWTLLRPMALFLILYIVFAVFLKVGDDIPHYPVYLLLGIVLWNYFVEVTVGSVESIVGKGDLLRKLNFPKYIVVLGGSVSAFINLIFNFIVLAMIMVFAGADPSPSAFYVLPLLIFELFVFSLGISFLLSALFVRFRDIKYIWEVVIQGAFYATPILYPLSLVPEGVSKILLLNPMAQIIQDARYVMVTPATQTSAQTFESVLFRLIPFIIVGFTIVLSAIYFRKRSRFFAEEA